MNIQNILALLVLLCFAGPALEAQQVLTWDQLRDRFLQSNPTLQADRVNVDESRAQEITAYLRPNPDVSFGLDQFTLFATPNTPYRPLAGVSEIGGISYLHEREHKRELRLEAARKATVVASSTHADLERTMLFTLRNSFVQGLQAKALLELAKQNLEYWDREIQINKDRYEAGDLARVDLNRINLQRAQYQADLLNAEVSLRTAKITLLAMLNDRTPIDKFDVVGSYDFQNELMPLEQLRQMAMEARPDLRAAVETLDEAKSNYKLAVANGSADPTFGIDAGRNPPLPSYLGFSVDFPLRIFDKNQGEKLRTKLDIDRASKSRMASEAQVLNDVDSARTSLASAVELLKPYKMEYLPQALEVRDIVTFAYQRGGASLLDFLDAQKDYRDTQLNYVNLIGNYLTAASQLNMAVGREVIQ